MQIFTTDADRRLEKTYDGIRHTEFTVPACSVTTVVIDNNLRGFFG